MTTPKKGITRVFVFASIAVIVMWLYFATPIKNLVSPEGFQRIRQWILDRGPAAPLAYIFLYVIATVFCVPGSFLTLAAGGVFGPVSGLLWVTIGSNLGANAAFFIGRYFGREFIENLVRRFGRKWESNDAMSGFNWILSLRLLPVVPFFILNYAAALTPVSWKNYSSGTFLGMLPAAIAFVYLGNALTNLSLTDWHTWKNPQVWGPFVGVIVFSGLVNVIKRRFGTKASAALPANRE